MTRMIYVILVSVPIVIYYVLKSRYVTSHMSDFPESYRYQMVRNMIRIMNRNGRIHAQIFGQENLPQEGGYVMYPNHQGKYDALGIISGHVLPCTFLIDEKRSHIPFAREVADLLEASRLNKLDPRAQVQTMREVINKVKEGKRYIIFPEGGYDNNRNTTQTFLAGAFRPSTKTKTPIIPVALIDTHKVYGINSLRKVRPQIHFLPPLTYEEYSKLNSFQIADMVRDRIQAKINEVLEQHSLTCHEASM